MILPGFKWADWAAVHARSLDIHKECYRQLNRESGGYYDPDKAASDFLDAEDAWCQESAAILGLSFEAFGALASKGQIHWRENFGQGYEIRFEGRIHPMHIKPVKP